jgi:ABC-type nitrate/sulfonate/bicarbonate transport system permease component
VTRTRSALLSVGAVAVALAIWMVVTVGGLVSPKILVSPIGLVRQFWVLAIDGYLGTPLYVHILASLLRTTVGFVCGAVLALPIGLAIGYSPTLYALLSPFLAVLRPIPVIAYIPLAILWFGIGEFSKILLIAITSFLYMSVNAAAGVKAVPQDVIRAALSLGASRLQLFAHVILPESLPYIFAGIRVGAAVSWAVVVSAELIAAQQGLGYIIMDAATFFRIPAVYVGIALIGLIGFGIDRLISFAERRLVHWNAR